MSLHHILDKSTLIISPRLPAIDHRIAKEFKERAQALIEGARYPLTILNLEGVHFIDSAGFAAMISLLKLLATQKSDLVLAAVTPQIHEIFQIMDMDLIFEIYPSVSAAQRGVNVRPSTLPPR